MKFRLYAMLRRLLVAGAYAGTDSAGRPFRTYEVTTGFMDPGAGDALIPDNGTERRREVAANFGRNTLPFYAIRANSPDRCRRGRVR